MVFTEIGFKGAFIIDIKKLEDDRGFFGRSYCQKEFQQHGIHSQIVQANTSFNKKKHTLRGLHLQLTPYEEAKLVRCTRGTIFDVIVDLRKDSHTYKQWFGVELTADSYRMLYIPEGFAHGYLTLEDNTDVMYHVSQFYMPHSEFGYRWDDPAFGIQWPATPEVVSSKDQLHAFFKDE